MADSGITATTSTYRLLNGAGEVIDVADLPTDGEALVWAEEVRRHRTPRVFVRRIERQDGDEWSYVSPSGDDE
ncbi:MAG: hypothetical protein QM747_04990 [Nocardioides sp.]